MSSLKRSQMKCSYCGHDYSIQDPEWKTPCCDFGIHRSCNDETLREYGNCFWCHGTQKRRMSLQSIASSAAPQYIHHFGDKPPTVQPHSQNIDGSWRTTYSGDVMTLEEYLRSQPKGIMKAPGQVSRPSSVSSEPWPYGPSIMSSDDSEESGIRLPGLGIADLETTKDLFLKVWREVERQISQADRVRIIQDVTLGCGSK